jgi:hypothetical protein
MKHRSGLIAGVASLFLVAGIAAAEEATPPKKEETRKKPAADTPQCTQVPGSHIRLAKPEDCSKAARGPYRSYSKEDLERTGESDVAEALRKLDPSFR